MNFLHFIRALKTLFIKIIHGVCLRFGRVNTEMSVFSQMIYKVNTTPIISLSSFFCRNQPADSKMGNQLKGIVKAEKNYNSQKH